MPDLKKLDELKDMLMTADDFGETVDFFFDHFGEDPEFMSLGKPIKSPLMKALLERLAKEFFGPEAKVTGKLFKHLKKQRFVHGVAHLDGRMAIVFFFQDIDMGMLVCQIGPESRMVRFTSYTVKGDEPLSIPAKTSRLVH